MNQFDIVSAVYEPKNKSDLQPDAEKRIGTRALFQAVWIVEDHDAYTGQWAMTWYPNTSPNPVHWVPECDLQDVYPIDVLADAGIIGNIRIRIETDRDGCPSGKLATDLTLGNTWVTAKYGDGWIASKNVDIDSVATITGTRFVVNAVLHPDDGWYLLDKSDDRESE